MAKRFFFGILFIGFSVPATFADTDPIRYFGTETLSLKADKTVFHVLKFDDETLADTLFEAKSAEGYSVSYFRKIKTDVCFDNKCRPLVIVLHWNITGRYLGFELPAGEYLSKAEHKPFIAAEYARLHEILADSHSPLGDFTYEDLTPQTKPDKSGVDAVSSATSKDVLSYVVEGAVYTTYKLWQILYGTTQKEIIRLTRKSLTNGLLLKVLQSPDRSDRIWALDQAVTADEVTLTLHKAMLQLISNDDFYLSEQALNSVDARALASDSLQLLLLAKFQKANFNLRNCIVTKLKQVSILNPKIKSALTEELETSQGTLLVNTLELFKKQENINDETTAVIAKLINNENRFIAQKSYEFLNALEIKNKHVQNLVRQYKSKQ